jgi:putative transposase
MKRKRHTPEEIIRKLRTAEEAMAGGRTVEEACRVIAVSVATYLRRKSQYSGVKKDALKRLRELEKENIRLKKLVADQSLDMAVLKEVAEGKWQARPASERRWPLCASVWK